MYTMRSDYTPIARVDITKAAIRKVDVWGTEGFESSQSTELINHQLRVPALEENYEQVKALAFIR